MSFDSLSLILVVSAAQGFFLAVIILFRQRKIYASRFLAALIFFYSFFILGAFISQAGFIEKYPRLLFLTPGLPLLFGPLHYLYASYLIHPQREKFPAIQWLHFLPFILFRLSLIRDMIRPAHEILGYIHGIATEKPLIPAWIPDWFLVLQGLTYMALTIRILQIYRHQIEDAFSTIEKINLSWLQRITYLATVVWVLIFIKDLVYLFEYRIFGDLHVEAILTAIYVYALGYLGLFKAEVFAWPEISQAIQKLEESQDSAREKYEKSGLTEETAQKHLRDLEKLMIAQKPFQKPDLTLHELSRMLSIKPHNLSEILNRYLQQNIYDYINMYRVKQVKRDMNDPMKENLTLLALALDAGFNSKSSFNSIFKKFTGVTPSAYRQSPVTD